MPVTKIGLVDLLRVAIGLPILALGAFFLSWLDRSSV